MKMVPCAAPRLRRVSRLADLAGTVLAAFLAPVRGQRPPWETVVCDSCGARLTRPLP